MALWLVRTDKPGDYEQRYLDDNRIHVCWPGLRHDVAKLQDREELKAIVREQHPNWSEASIGQRVGQLWSFVHKIKPGDWVVVPSRRKSAIHVCEVTSDYRFDGDAEDPLYHYRDVRWIECNVPRSNFAQDLLYCFAARKTVAQMSKHDAERRVKQMAENEWKPVSPQVHPPSGENSGDGDEPDDGHPPADLAQLARDEIAQLIIAKFKGHGMERLVDSILRAQGYTTHVSPEGPDKGIDILAAPGPLGFGDPKVCVQVKSTDGPIDHPTLTRLVGAMQNVHAKQGLLVSWGGFKSSVDKERAGQFFSVRLWDQKDLIEQLLAHYEDLDDDLRTELPLKRIWIVAEPDAEA